MASPFTLPHKKDKFDYALRLDPNDVWNVPEAPENEVHFESEHVGPWSICKSIRGLCIAYREDGLGKIYGLRTMYAPKSEGYSMSGRVSIDGKKRRAFTSSVMFQREDGSLCTVAALYLCSPKAEGTVAA